MNIFQMSESTKPDDLHRHHSMKDLYTSYQHNYKKKGELSEQTVSPILSPRGHIDPETLMDAQSNGLAFRANRYREESTKNSRISNRLYKKPGDYPIIHLDKTKLILNRKKSVANPPKIARIGHPDPSTYRTNIRSEILRNGTLMPQMPTHHHEDLDKERVELDPLDALKEISRKRIHCENTNHSKQVKPIDATDSNVALSNSKRQRITISPISPTDANENKKRHCSTKNNDILSSLSSSSHMIRSPAAPKRPIIISPTNSITSPQTKRVQLDTPIHAQVNSDPLLNSIPKTADVITTKALETSHPVEPAQPKLSLFNRKYQSFVPPSIISESDSDDECKIAFVKPKLTTGLTKEGISNLLKLKPVEKTKLSLMLSCLSGELDDNDTVDAKETSKEATVFKTVNIITSKHAEETQNVMAKPSEDGINQKVDSTSKLVPAIVTTTTPEVVSSPVISTLVFTKPTSQPATNITASITSTSVTNTSGTVAVAAVPAKEVETSKASDTERRKGGFSFPLTSTVKPIVTSTTSSTPSSFSSTVAPTAKTTTEPLPKDTQTPNITFEFQTSNQITLQASKPPSTVAPIVEPTKPFTFGIVSSTTAKPKTILAFGPTSPANLFPSLTTNVTKGTSAEQTIAGFGDASKPNSFPAFGQSPTVSSATFGTTMPSNSPSTQSSLNKIIFGAPTYNSTSQASPKAQPTSFGSSGSLSFSSITQQPSSSAQQSVHKDQSNVSTSVFSKTAQPIFGGNPASNGTKIFDFKTPNGVTTPSFASVQPSKPSESIPSFGSTMTTKAPYTFGAATTTTVTPTFNAAQPTQSMFSIGSKTVNSSTNVFGSSSTHSATPLFGSETGTKTDIFDQSSKIDNNYLPNRSEPQKTTQNIFGSSNTKTPSTFSFSGTQPTNTTSMFGERTTPDFFSFGGSDKKSEISTTESSGDTKKTFTFGGNLAASSKPVEFGVTTFGSSNVNDAAKTFGFTTNNTATTTNLFGNNATNETSKPFTFGGNNSTPAFVASKTPSFGNATSTPSFGSSSTTPSFGNSNTTSGFGGSNTTPAFGNSNTAPAFGSSSATPAFENANTKPAFGSSIATPAFGSSSSTSAFGSLSSTPAFGSSNAAPAFGSSSATPAFGCLNATPSFGNASTTPAIGSSSATPAFGSSGATPSFGNTNTTPAFGANSNTTPSFGNTNTITAFGSASTTPSFGGNSGTPTFGANIGTPTFGSSGTATFGATNFNISGGSGFGGNISNPAFVTSTGTADANKTFNFTGNDPTPSPIPNLFNIGPTNSSPRGRTIRTARRSNR